MKKFKRWIRNKLRKFLYVDELECNLSDFNAIMQKAKSSLEYEIKKLDSKIDEEKYNINATTRMFRKDISDFQNTIDVLHNTIENVVHIGTDVYRENTGHSWAVICIEGNMNIVKFVELDRKDARDVMYFLKQFEAGRHCIDTPYKQMFYDGLFKF